MTAVVLILALVAVIAFVTRYDAVGFPRQGTPAEQRAFHRAKLYPLQAALFGGYALLAWALTNELVNPFALALAAIVGTAAHDLGYWIWRFALKLSRYQRGQFFSREPYTKRTNLLFFALTLGGGSPGTGPKWLDTTCRLVGLAVAVAILWGVA